MPPSAVDHEHLVESGEERPLVQFPKAVRYTIPLESLRGRGC